MKSLTVIIPALNEAGNLSDAVKDILPFLESLEDYEILIFNDSSRDQTGSIADQLALENKKIKVIHNPRTMGFGYNYKKGVELAEKDYVTMIPGDRDLRPETYQQMIEKIGTKDIILAYTANMGIRPRSRQILSMCFTALMNFLFGMDLKYFNGMVIHQRSLIQSVKIKTDSFAFQAEALIKLIKSGHTYDQVPQWIQERQYGKSKALHLKNVIKVLKSIARLFYEIQMRQRY